MVYAFEATDAFHQLQVSLQQQKQKLSLEDHIHYALACTSILLLPPDDLRRPQLITINHIEHTYNIKKPPMPTNTDMDIVTIIEEVLNGTATREMAVRELLNFDPTIKNVYKFAKATAKLIEKLPRVSLSEEYNEMELCSRFVDPFLSEMFDDPDQDIFLRWTNEATLEAKNEQSTLNWRPDLSITKLQSVKWSSSLGFGEEKPACQESNLYAIIRAFPHFGWLPDLQFEIYSS